MNATDRATPYFAYGLTIASEIALPGPRVVANRECVPDLVVRVDTLAGTGPSWEQAIRQPALPSPAPWLSLGRTPCGYLIRVAGAADFGVSMDGREIACRVTVDGDDDALSHWLLDLVIPLTFKLRGWEALHATAVQTPRGVCAFIGPTGSGKSTLAASFLKAGYPVVSDDCLLLHSHGGGVHAVPAYPGVRLCQDTLAAMSEAESPCRPVGRHTTKLRWLPRVAVDTFPEAVQPLARIYRLMRANDTNGNGAIPASRLEPMSSRSAFMELVDNTFRLDAVDRGMLAREFRFWESAALAVPMRRLWLEDDVRSASAREAVLQDLG